ncbi:MAG: hypothetical protein KF870_00550 [Leadbetterella sp.]|nr:hypothetical protein [Leadbetterella sp.]
MKKLILASVVAALSFSCARGQYRERAYAHEDHRGYDRDAEYRIESFQRQAWRKIETGRRQGRLSRGEYNRLMRKYNEIEVMQRRALRNGRISPGERRDLEREMAALDRMIHRDLRNRF